MSALPAGTRAKLTNDEAVLHPDGDRLSRVGSDAAMSETITLAPEHRTQPEMAGIPAVGERAAGDTAGARGCDD